MESYFTQKGIPYVCRDIRRDPVARREWRDLYGGEIVPMVVFDNGRKIVDGCDLSAIERALRELSPPPPPSQPAPSVAGLAAREKQ